MNIEIDDLRFIILVKAFKPLCQVLVIWNKHFHSLLVGIIIWQCASRILKMFIPLTEWLPLSWMYNREILGNVQKVIPMTI